MNSENYWRKNYAKSPFKLLKNSRKKLFPVSRKKGRLA